MLLIYAICGGLGLLSLVLSGANQVYAFMGVFVALGVVLFFLAWGGFSDTGLEAESYGEGDVTDAPR